MVYVILRNALGLIIESLNPDLFTTSHKNSLTLGVKKTTM